MFGLWTFRSESVMASNWERSGPIIAAIIVSALIILICYFVWKKRRNRGRNTQRRASQPVQMHSIGSTPPDSRDFAETDALCSDVDRTQRASLINRGPPGLFKFLSTETLDTGDIVVPFVNRFANDYPSDLVVSGIKSRQISQRVLESTTDPEDGTDDAVGPADGLLKEQQENKQSVLDHTKIKMESDDTDSAPSQKDTGAELN